MTTQLKKRSPEQQRQNCSISPADQKSYQDNLESQLNNLSAAIDRLEAKSRQLEQQKISPDPLAELIQKQKEVESQLKKLQNSSDEAWLDLQQGIDAAWKELNQAFNKALTHFQ